MSEPKTLLLTETGVARLDDGSEAVNVGPIVSALGFLTEGRGDDRGTDEHGTPLPDLLSLAFDVVQSIILGGRQAEYFRGVKHDFDARSGLDGRASLALAKQAKTVRPSTPGSALEKAAAELRLRLKKLDELSLGRADATELKQAIDGFRSFGADRWVAATSNLLLALNALEAGKPKRRAEPRSKSKPLAKRVSVTKTKTRARARKAGAKPKSAKPRKPAKRRA